MKKFLSLALALAMLLTSVSALAEGIGGLPDKWWEAADLQPSETFYVEGGMTVTAMGVHFNQYPTEFDGCYYFPSIEKLTGMHFDIDWRTDSDYGTQVATTLANGIENLPDMIHPGGGYSQSVLANEGAIIALDDYLDLIPNIVEAVGEDRMSNWRAADGHIYTIPTIVNVPGSQTMAIRKDWLDALGMDMPTTWEEWKAYWYAVRDNDMNGNGDKSDEIPLVLEMGATGER